MTLNPITALSDQLQKLINEHGSAAILRDHLALFKDQIVILEKKAASLESENAILKAENDKFKSETQNLRIANNELATKIQTYENPIQDNLLDEPKVKILMFLSTQTNRIVVDYIAPATGLSHQATLFHLEELAKRRMVSKILNMINPTTWSLAQEGRRYLIEHNLL